ncbi:GNAT family N-acetyltransferase [Paenibacillus athensensis]|uniref:GNAT family N-acetyltransferase n=1 Tax=Paenibacillus athensensis TaxID=1967502 RepID=A0A4Y8PY40_9BACL|nr:GNAT family N-acetyltransferase [Paenibacillus athensensis]MCD1259373.1 GNAT family N-acetyltransferase [Paenibacillus athensensis]
MTLSRTMREAALGDAAVLHQLFEQLVGHDLLLDDIDRRLAFVKESPIEFLYVCEEQGEVKGALAFRLRENIEDFSRFGEVSLIVVNEQCRRQGLGEFMMHFAEQLAAEKHCIGTWLVSGFGREEQAHRFYKELGYEINGYRFVKRA